MRLPRGIPHILHFGCLLFLALCSFLLMFLRDSSARRPASDVIFQSRLQYDQGEELCRKANL